MRFLLFNLVVVGALYYLFTADQAELAGTAARASGVVAELRATAGGMVRKLGGARPEGAEARPAPVADGDGGRGTASLVGEGSGGERETPLSGRVSPEGGGEVAPQRKDVGTRESPRKPVVRQPSSGDEVTPGSAGKSGASTGETGTTDTTSTANPRSPQETGEGAAIVEGKRAMTPGERQKALYGLAREMETFFVDKALR